MKNAVSKKIKENCGNKNFSFENVSKKDILNLNNKLPGNKATVSNVLVPVLKGSISTYYEKLIIISNFSNNCIIDREIIVTIWQLE